MCGGVDDWRRGKGEGGGEGVGGGLVESVVVREVCMSLREEGKG